MAAILDLVRRGNAHSRSEIIERTGLSRAIVTQRVSELLAVGLLEEALSASTGGRPPRQLRFCAEAGHLLMADIGATSIDVAVGRPFRKDHRAPRRARRGRVRPDKSLGRVEGLFDRMVDEVRSPGSVWGLGSVCPALWSSGRAARSLRRSCPDGTGSPCASNSPSVTARRSGSTTTSTSWPSGSSAPASPGVIRTPSS